MKNYTIKVEGGDDFTVSVKSGPFITEAEERSEAGKIGRKICRNQGLKFKWVVALTIDQDQVFQIVCKETGALIEEADTADEAKAIVAQYEKDDKIDGTYTPQFYEIKIKQDDN